MHEKRKKIVCWKIDRAIRKLHVIRLNKSTLGPTRKYFLNKKLLENYMEENCMKKGKNERKMHARKLLEQLKNCIDMHRARQQHT